LLAGRLLGKRLGQLFRIGRTWLRVEPLARFTPFHDFDHDDDLPF
jgi:hypothetical protein